MDLHSLPYPIASLYQEMLDEPDPGHRLRALVKTFAGFLKFTSLIAIGDYLDSSHSDKGIDLLLTSWKIDRPALGTWNEFLREILRSHHKAQTQPRVRGLLEFYQSERGAKSAAVETIDQLIALRNEFIHPDIWPRPEAASRLYEQHLPALDALLDAATFLRDYGFVYRQSGQRTLCMGATREGFRDLGPDGGRADGFELQREGEPPLPFLAFLVYGETDADEADTAPPHDDILLYETRAYRRVKYVRGNHLAYQREDAFASSNRALARLKERLGQLDERLQERFVQSNAETASWAHLIDHCRRVSGETLALHARERKYSPRLYVHRIDAERHFAEFMQAPATICNIVGDSGRGKTNLLCHLTDACLREGHAVLHVYARALSDEPFESQLAAQFVPTPERFIPYLCELSHAPVESAQPRLIVFVDAINEHRDPVGLYRELLDFDARLREAGVRLHKIVASSRVASWERIERAHELTTDRVHFAASRPGAAARPCVVVGSFSDEEAISAYRRYTLQPADTEPERRWKREALAVRLATPYEQLPAGIRHLAANPIFLRFLSSSYDSIARDLTESDVLLEYFEHSVPRRHRFFLQYFLEALWLRRADYLRLDDLVQDANQPTGAAAHALHKIREYVEEDAVEATRDVLVCESNDPATGQRCDAFGDELERLDAPSLHCPRCGQALAVRKLPVHSTFNYLKEQGVVSTYASENGPTVLRFTYDRFFEIMMARHLLRELDLKSQEPAARMASVSEWVHALAGNMVFRDAAVQFLALLLGNRCVTEDAAIDSAQRHLQTTPGVLYRLERVAFDSASERLLDGLLASPQPLVLSMVRQAVVRAGRDRALAAPLSRFVERVAERAMSTRHHATAQLEFARFALATSAELGDLVPFLSLARHRSASIRTLAVSQAYYLWKNHPALGMDLLERAAAEVYGPIGLPRLDRLELVVALAMLMMFLNPRDTASVNRALAVVHGVMRRSRLWLWIISRALPLVARRVLREVPSDINPVNFAELERGKRDLHARPELKAALLDYIGMLRQEHFDADLQARCVATFQRVNPHNNICYLVHQLVQGFRASQDLAATVRVECQIALRADPAHHQWIQAPLYTAQWLLSRTPRIATEERDQVAALWRHCLASGNFAFPALSPGSAYHNWSLAYFALLEMKHSGSARNEEILAAVRRLIDERSNTGLYAFFRGMDIVGAELSALYPEALRLVAILLPHLVNKNPDLPEASQRMIARTLQRMRVLHGDEVELMLGSIEDRSAQARIREFMAAEPLNESIGTLVSACGQDFYLYAMSQPLWRLRLAEFMETLVRTRNLTNWLLRSLRYLGQEMDRHFESTGARTG